MEKRTIEIFSMGCLFCNGVISKILLLAPRDYEIEVLEMNHFWALMRANERGIDSFPAVIVDGRLLDFRTEGELDAELQSVFGTRCSVPIQANVRH